MITPSGRRLLQAALEYADYGWQLIPVYGIIAERICQCRDKGDCGSPGKHPRLKTWQKAATTDEEILASWFDDQWPDTNLGVALGERSGIIDVECDSDEAEEGLFTLFGGELPETPTFQAGRGKHRLFRWTNELPFPDKAVFKLFGGKLEFRTGNGAGMQSVFPPSVHWTGKQYTWLIHPSETTPADIPDEALARIYAELSGEGMAPAPSRTGKPIEHWREISRGVAEGRRNETAASFIGKVLRGMADPFDADAVAVQWELVQSWNERNKPPLDAKELEQTFRSILERHRTNVRGEPPREKRGRGSESGSPDEPFNIDGWRLVQVLSDPITWKLYSPEWPGQFITLTEDEIFMPRRIRVKASRMRVGIGPWFEPYWSGGGRGKNYKPGIAEDLITHAEIEEASVEQKRYCVIADMIWDQVCGALERDKPNQYGKMTKLPDGTYWFKHSRLLSDLNQGTDKVAAEELTRVLNEYLGGGVERKVKRVEGNPYRYMVLTGQAVDRLRELAFQAAELVEDEEEALL